MKCKHCGSEILFIMKGKIHIGLYCGHCFSWVNWIKKKEYPLYKRMYKEIKNNVSRETLKED